MDKLAKVKRVGCVEKIGAVRAQGTVVRFETKRVDHR
jgi:hypothetical protein